MKVKVKKSGKLKRRLWCTSLSHIANHKNDVKDIYLFMLRYDIGMYSKYYKNLYCKTIHWKRMGNADGEVTYVWWRGSSRNAPTSEGHPTLSQEDSFGLIQMVKYKERLLMMCDDTAVIPRKVTNRWTLCTFESFAAHGAEKFPDNNKICTDVLFHSVTALIDFATLIGILATMDRLLQ